MSRLGAFRLEGYGVSPLMVSLSNHREILLARPPANSELTEWVVEGRCNRPVVEASSR